MVRTGKEELKAELDKVLADKDHRNRSADGKISGGQFPDLVNCTVTVKSPACRFLMEIPDRHGTGRKTGLYHGLCK